MEDLNQLNNIEIAEFIEKWQREEAERIQEIEKKMIDLEIEKIVSRWLKHNKHFRKVKTIEESTAIFIFIRSNLSRYNLIYNEKTNDTLEKFANDKRITLVYIQNTNPHDKNRSTLGLIKRKVASAKKIYD